MTKKTFNRFFYVAPPFFLENRRVSNPIFNKSKFQLGFLALIFGLSACSGDRPEKLGVVDGKLISCPDTPNCISSLADDPKHHLPPLKLSEPAIQVWNRLKAVVSSQKRSKIITEKGYYLHAEFTSLVFRFVDDVEFLLDEKSATLHFRSASRIGRSDLGANRKRMEKILSELGS